MDLIEKAWGKFRETNLAKATETEIDAARIAFFSGAATVSGAVEIMEFIPVMAGIDDECRRFVRLYNDRFGRAPWGEWDREDA